LEWQHAPKQSGPQATPLPCQYPAVQAAAFTVLHVPLFPQQAPKQGLGEHERPVPCQPVGVHADWPATIVQVVPKQHAPAQSEAGVQTPPSANKVPPEFAHWVGVLTAQTPVVEQQGAKQVDAPHVVPHPRNVQPNAVGHVPSRETRLHAPLGLQHAPTHPFGVQAVPSPNQVPVQTAWEVTLHKAPLPEQHAPAQGLGLQARNAPCQTPAPQAAWVTNVQAEPLQHAPWGSGQLFGVQPVPPPFHVCANRSLHDDASNTVHPPVYKSQQAPAGGHGLGEQTRPECHVSPKPMQPSEVVRPQEPSL
jgi:hypothetical protein